MADGSVPIVLSPEPFSRAVAYLEQPAGRTLKGALVEAVRAGSISADDLSRTVVYVDGVRLGRDETLDHVLQEGQVVNIVVEPLGGGGGRKEIGQILMTIVVIAVSMWVGGPGGAAALGSTLLAQVAAAAILTLGQAAVAALFAPDAQSKAKANERYALQTASNQYRPWAPFPMAIGEVICAPDFAAKTFTQALGDDVWIYGILGLHYGPCEVGELKIGDTLVSSMGAGDFRMAQHLTPGPREFSIYANDTDQLDLQEELEATTGAATPVIRAASAEGERFEFDFFLPAGLHFQKDDGRVITAAVTLTVRYRPIDEDGVPTGAGTWAAGLTIPLSSTTKEPWRVMRSLSLPLGRYEFEVKRSLKPDTNEKRRDDVGLTAIRAIAFRKPVADETLSIIEFAVRATALNQGTLAPITCRLKPKCETWNGAAWTAPVATSNPAALTRWLLTGPAPARPLQPEQADVRLRAWSDLCEEYDWKVGIYLTDDRRQADVMGMVEQAGRASLWWDGTQIVASAWVEKPAPRQLFTGSNLKDHRWTIIYPEPVHALRVEFANIEEGGDPDELFVYADGYAEVADPEAGLEAATLVEALRIEGQKTPDRAYRDGRWELGARLHRRRIDTWTADVEHLVSGYGDRVRLAWQRVEGATSSRVRCRRWTGNLVSGVRLAQPVEMVPGESYAVDIRLTSEVIVAVAVINPADDAPVMTREIQFAVPREPGSSPKRDDLVAFGVPTRISEDTEIIGIEPGERLTASITGVRYVAPLLMAGETGPIPPLQTRLTRQRQASPPPPQLLGVQNEPSGVRVSFAMPPWAGSPISGFAARWRPTPANGEDSGWMTLPALAATATTLVTPPPRALPIAQGEVEGATFIDVEIRALTESGQSSPEPLFVEAIEVREDPFEPTTLSVTPAVRQAPDGSSHGVLVVSVDALGAAQGVDLIVEVRRAPVAGAPDPWESAGLTLAAANPVGDILGLRSGERYGVRAAWRTAAGWPSQWTEEVRATVPADSNVASDTVNVGGVPAEDVAGQASQVPTLSALLQDAQNAIATHQATLYTATTGLVALTAALFATLDTPTTGVLARLTASESTITANNSAAVSRLNALEATVNTAGTGVVARLGVAENAIATNNSAAVSRLNALEATVNTAGTGLSALVASQAGAISSLQTGKADASRVSVVEARSNGAFYLNPNPGFDNYTHPNYPTGWDGWVLVAGSDYYPAADGTGGFSLVATGRAGENSGFEQLLPVNSITPNSWNVTEVIVELDGVGDYTACGIYAVVTDAAGSGLTQAFLRSFALVADDEGTISATKTGRRSFSWLWQADSNGANSRLRQYLMGHWSSHGSLASANRTKWHFYGTRRATPTEIEQRNARGGYNSLSARYAAIETATVNLQTGKADVTRVATLEAQIHSNANLIANPNGYEGLTTNWGTDYTNDWFLYEPEPGNQHRQSGVGSTTGQRNFYSQTAVSAGQPLTFSADVYCSGAPGTQAGVSISGWNGTSFTLSKASQYIAGGVWTRLSVHVTAAEAAGLQYVYPGISASLVNGAVAFRRPKLEYGTVATPYTDERTQRVLAAGVTSAQQAVATLEGRLEARALLQVVAGNQVAGMQVLAVSGPDASYSAVNFWAGSFQVSNNGTSPVAPFVVRDNAVRINELTVDRVAVGTSIVVGSRRLKLAVQPFAVPCTDGVPVSFGYDIGLPPDIVFLRDGAVQQPGAGESNNYYAEAPSGTGFTPRLKIVTAGTPTNQTAGPSGASSSGIYEKYFALAAAAASNIVNVRVTGVIQSEFVNPNYNPGGPPQADDGTSYSDGYMQIAVYGFAGAWSVIGYLDVYPAFRSAYSDPPGTYNDSFDTASQPFTVTPSTTHVGVGVAYESHAGSAIADLRLAYQTASASGTRSATPNGEMSTAMIYPKNGA